jgi:NAD(P)-dependent dehydrogenase (short-subunit alcohol dehydrogenase family)
MNKPLAGKVVIVTGGASGIGAATCPRFGEEGAKVVVSDINESGGKDIVRQIRAAGGEALSTALSPRAPTFRRW